LVRLRWAAENLLVRATLWIALAEHLR
jgi:hypothetical protein